MSVKIVCAWCGKTIFKGDGKHSLISHGICHRCRLNVKREIEEFCDQLKHSDKERRPENEHDNTGKCH